MKLGGIILVNTYSDSVMGYREMNVPFNLISIEDNTKNLAIFLPGAGYTTQRPLFHYSEAIFVNNNFDVLQVNYQYNDKIYDEFSIEELSEAIRFDVKTVIDKVLKDNSYDNFYIVGKSLGTIAMCSELSRDIFKEAKTVWLTPLLQRDDVFEAMLSSENNGLCFIGDNDPCYIEERYNQLLKNTFIVSRLFPNVNHGMEYDTNTLGSIDVLKSVINDISKL